MKHLVITYSAQYFFSLEKLSVILKVNIRWNKTFKIVKLGTALLEIIEKGEKYWLKFLLALRLFNSSLEITALGDQKASRIF